MDTPFSEKATAPFRLSIYQEPDGWREGLQELDRLNHLALKGDWFPFRQADVWIYFLESEDELADIGGGVDALYWSIFKREEPLPLSRRIDFESDNGRAIMLLFYFVGDFASNTDEFREFVCKSRLAAINDISGPPRSLDLKKTFEYCSNE